MSLTQTTLSILDAQGVSRTIKALTDGTNFTFGHSLLDTSGTPVTPATRSSTVTLYQTITRPANTTAYSQLSAYNQGAFLVGSNGVAVMPFAGAAGTAGTGVIFGGKFSRNRLDYTNAVVFRAHLFVADPTSNLGSPADGATYNDFWANDQISLGYIDFNVSQASNNITVMSSQLPNGPIPYNIPSGTSLYVVIEIRGSSGYVPNSGEISALTLFLSVDQ